MGNEADAELLALLKDLKSAQKWLVIPTTASLVLALQAHFTVLEPLRPVGLWGSVHCIGFFLLALWQDVPDLKVLKQRLHFQDQAHLVLNIVGCVVAVSWITEDNKNLCRMALVFLLPLVSAHQVGEFQNVGADIFQAFLVVHFAVVCGHFKAGFWSDGWQFCLVSLVFDLLVLTMAKRRARAKQELLDITCGTLQQLLTCLSDGCCLLNKAGSIVMSDGKMCSLVGAGLDDLDGLPFCGLLATDAPKEKGRPEEGLRNTTLRSFAGATIRVESHTFRCQLPLELAGVILNEKKYKSSSVDARRPVYLRLVKCFQQDPEVKPQLPRRGSSRVSASGLSSVLGGDYAQNRAISEVSSLVGSDLSGNTNPTVVSLANVRLQMMSDRTPRPQPIPEGGMPVTLELDLPASEAASSVVSDSPMQATPMHARMRLDRLNSGPRSCLSGLSGCGLSGCGGAESEVSSNAGCEEGETQEDLVSTEVVNLGASKDGRMRVQVNFRSQLLSQQHSMMNTMSTQLESARRDLHVQAGVQEQQNEVLRRFQKIVSREFTLADNQSLSTMTVFILEENKDMRTSLEQQCSLLHFQCHTCVSPPEGIKVIEEGIKLLAAAGKGASKPVKNKLTLTPLPDAPPKSSPSMRARTEAPPMQLVLLSTSLLTQLSVEVAQWIAAGCSVVLLADSKGLSEVYEAMSADGEDELREKLRLGGIHEWLHYPVSVDKLRGVAQSALQRKFGDDFLLMQQLGKGGTSTVYSAKRLRDGEVFALKEINVSRLMRRKTGPEDLEKLWAEADMLRQVQWPTVMTLADAWQSSTGKLLYMLMPCLAGGSLRDRVAAASKAEGQGISTEEAVQWYAQVLHGLSCLHWCGIIHRDIKTENLLLASDGRSVRLADLGSAMRLPGDGPHPAPRACVSAAVTTSAICAPEVILQGTALASSDMWSVGATFYEVFTLRSLLPADAPITDYAALVTNVDLGPIHECRRKVVHASGEGGCDAGAGPRPSLEATPAELLQRAPADVVTQLADLLQQDQCHRPAAADLMLRPLAKDCLAKMFIEAAVLEEAQSHFKDLARIAADSEAAGGLGRGHKGL